HLAYGSAAPHRDDVAGLDVRLNRRLPSGRKDVGEEKELLVVDPVRNLDMGRVGEGNAQIFRLPARIAAGEVGVAEQARRAVPERLVPELALAVGAAAHRIIAAQALVALAALDGEGNDDPVADGERSLGRASDLDHLAHALMAE